MLSDQELVRRNKLQRLVENDVDVYPEKFAVSTSIKEAQTLNDNAIVSIAGRITALRGMGKIIFGEISDIQGKIQIMFSKASFEEFNEIDQLIDLGDFIGVKGELFKTNSGEKTVRVKSYKFLGKALRPLPEKWNGLTDIETRYRQRYLDLIMNEEIKHRFLLRSKMLKEIRNFLDSRKFIEVETPILQNKASGAIAKPFSTHHNALDIDMFLRIAPETYLKRLIAGGFTNVYEVAKCFRNEGVSPQHLQEFTMIEGYSSYSNYMDSLCLMEDLVKHILLNLFNTLIINIDGYDVDFGNTWKKISFRDIIFDDCGIDIEKNIENKELLSEIMSRGIQLDHDNINSLGRGNLIDLLYKKVSRPKIIEPTFLLSHPIDLSPLARANDSNKLIADRFQLVVNGAELINAYSELVDPIDQRSRLEKQALLKANGDEEAMEMDDEYLLAMEHGMPPISGWGFGVDRMLQIFSGAQNIKDCVLFPVTRNKTGS
ncbi:lysyl-tRNA synthetase, class II [Paenibacillaceae bacterium GAS479]|nr:lysyl-tRNA synthetase, class II [Paenibacillaceae bacterium GAS479]